MILVAIHQGPKEDAADQGEDGGVGSNAEGEGEDDGDGQPFLPEQGSKGEFQVAQEGHRVEYKSFQ